MAKPPIPKKPVHFVGSSAKDLRSLPKGVRFVFGYALLMAQKGLKHPDAKPLKGFGGAGVLESVEDSDGDTYRLVYTVKYANAIYVLHTFQKKSNVGHKTPPRHLELITKRLRDAEEHYKENYAPKKK